LGFVVVAAVHTIQSQKHVFKPDEKACPPLHPNCFFPGPFPFHTSFVTDSVSEVCRLPSYILLPLYPLPFKEIWSRRHQDVFFLVLVGFGRPFRPPLVLLITVRLGKSFPPSPPPFVRASKWTVADRFLALIPLKVFPSFRSVVGFVPHSLPVYLCFCDSFRCGLITPCKLRMELRSYFFLSERRADSGWLDLLYAPYFFILL